MIVRLSKARFGLGSFPLNTMISFPFFRLFIPFSLSCYIKYVPFVMIPLSLIHQTLLWVFIVSILALLWSIQTVGTHRLTSFLDGMNWAQVLFLNVLYIHALFEGCWRLKITWLWKEFHNFSEWAIKSLLKNDFFYWKNKVLKKAVS